MNEHGSIPEFDLLHVPGVQLAGAYEDPMYDGIKAAPPTGCQPPSTDNGSVGGPRYGPRRDTARGGRRRPRAHCAPGR